MAGEVLLEPLTTESKSAILAIDGVEEAASFAVTNGNRVIPVEITHVVTAVDVFVDVALTGRAERLDSILLTLDHANVVLRVLYDVHRFAGVDFVAFHAVTAKVLDTFHWERLIANGHLVRLHRFLDLFTDLTEDGIDTGGLDTSLCRFLHSFDQWVVARVEGHGEGAVRHQTLNLRAIVDLHHVIGLEYSLITHIGSPMCSTVVQAGTCGERNSCIKSASFNQTAVRLFNLIGDIHDLHARPDVALCKFTRLAMNLCGPSQ